MQQQVLLAIRLILAITLCSTFVFGDCEVYIGYVEEEDFTMFLGPDENGFVLSFYSPGAEMVNVKLEFIED